MTDLTDNVETEILEWLFMNTAVRAPSATVYVALHTTDPGEAPDGTTELDNATLSYERAETAAGTAWTVTGNTATTTVEVSFPQATEDWGTVTHFTLWDGADDLANPLFSDVLRDSNGNATTKTVSMDDTLSFAAGSLTATLD